MLSILGKISLLDNVIIAYTREDLSNFKSSIEAPKCEICGTNHIRNELYIVEEDGVRYTAGKACMEKKFGKKVVRYAFDAAQAEEKNIAANCFETKASIIAALYQHQEEGFEKGETGNRFKCRYGDYFVESRYSEMYENLQKVADRVIEHFINIEATNTFVDSLKTLVGNKYHSDKVLGLFPAMVNSYYRDLELARQKQLAAKETVFFGEDGDKVKNANLECTVIAVRHCDGYYGSYTQTYLQDQLGHVFVWANTFAEENKACGNGSKITLINFTVKNHFTGRLGNATMIIRPKYQVTSIVELK